MVLLTGSYTHLLIWIKTTKDLLTIWQSNPSSFALNRGFYTPKKKKIKEPEKLTLFYCLNPDSLALFPDHISFKRLMYLALHLLKLRNHLCLARPPHHYSAVEAQNASATLPQAFSCVLKFLFKAVPFRDLGAKTLSRTFIVSHKTERLLLLVIAWRVIAKNSSHLNCLSSSFSSSGSSKLGSLPHIKAALQIYQGGITRLNMTVTHFKLTD